MPVSAAPRIVTGGRSPAAAETAAPIRVSGAMIRRIGRRESDASPIRVDTKGCAARTPLSIRIVLPELPQSRGPGGAARPRRPRPSIVTTAGSPSRCGVVRETIAPSAAMQSSVEAQSAPGA
jgi:hypothetical protein